MTDDEIEIEDAAAEVDDDPTDGLDAVPDDDDDGGHPAVSGDEGFEE